MTPRREEDMATVEFHCEHCGKLIRAPENAGGQTGKCPHCKGMNYIPLPPEEVGEIPLAPLDEAEERRRRQSAVEDSELMRNVLHERDTPGEPTRRRQFRRPDAPAQTPAVAPLSPKQLTSAIVSFIEAMSLGQLEKADEMARRLSGHGQQVNKILDNLQSENMAGYGLPSLPRPVLLGFVKQLRARF